MLVVVRDDADVPGQEEQEQPHQDQAARQDHQLPLLAATHFLALCPLSLEGQIKARRVSALSSPELSRASVLFESVLCLRPILPSRLAKCPSGIFEDFMCGARTRERNA